MLENNPAATLAQSEELQEKALMTFLAEQLHYSGANLEDPKLVEAFGQDFVDSLKAIKIPRKKWRKELWKRLLNTAFQSPEEQQANSKGQLTQGGFALGQIINGLELIASLAEDPDLREDFDLESIELEELKQAKANAKQNLANIDSVEGDQINEGFHTALRSNRGGKQWVGATSATQRHELMLLLGDQLEQMRSVEKMYDHLTDIACANGDKDLGISRSTFKEFCNEIGLQGRRYKRLKAN